MTINRDLTALRRHRVPSWWLDAKLGIFVHWTPASVPAFAPTEAEIGQLVQSGRSDALADAPYSEWYENSLRFPDSPAARHHRAVYGDRPYESFADDWVEGLAGFDPAAWAKEFAATGARYVVLVAKHMDGYCLWPSEVPNPHRPGWHSPRDVVGELAEAVRGAGMRFGLYYSGGFDSTFNAEPIGSMAGVTLAVPRGDYPAYAEAQVRELIERYRPSVLWNDVAWPAEGKELWPLLRHYYAEVPDGVVNDRWMPWSPLFAAMRSRRIRSALDRALAKQARRDGGLIPPAPPYFDVRTPEYVTFDSVQPRPWECVRGIDRSFGYNEQSGPEHFLEREELLDMLVDIVAKGGNLLLNVGPRGSDASIPDEQLTRLRWLADWVAPRSSAIFATRPWVTAGTTTPDGRPVRYTTRGETVYAFVQQAAGTTSVTLPDVAATATTAVSTLDGVALDCRPSSAAGPGLEVDLTPLTAAAGETMVLELRSVTANRLDPGGEVSQRRPRRA